MVALCASRALGVDTTGWCGNVAENPVIVCDDFDDYCPDPPCDDAIGDDTPDQEAFLTVWPSDGCHTEPDALGESTPINALIQADATCGEWVRTWNPDTLCWEWANNSGTSACADVDSEPFALRQDKGLNYPNAREGLYIFDGTSHRHDLRPRITELDPANGSVNGTDNDPLVLQFVLYLPGDSMHRYEASQANRYIELTDGSDRAPTEVSILECGDDPNPANNKFRPHVATDDNFDHNAIAIGMFAATGPNVCDLLKLLTYRLSVYDGAKWYELKGNASHPELKVGGGLNYVTLTIRSDELEIRIDSTWDQAADGEGACGDADGVGEPWTATAVVPRFYTGGFTAMHVGNGACLPSVAKDYVDNVALTGGVLEPAIPTGACCVVGEASSECRDETTQSGCEKLLGGTYAGDATDCAGTNCVTPPGACCLPNGTCTETDLDNCVTNLGGEFNGILTQCSDPGILCCADPFADADGDGDVDQDDFAFLQSCYTGGSGVLDPSCECLDAVQDGLIDQYDLGAFEQCASGPGVPAIDTCDDPL
jgi:hypothetical protein